MTPAEDYQADASTAIARAEALEGSWSRTCADKELAEQELSVLQETHKRAQLAARQGKIAAEIESVRHASAARHNTEMQHLDKVQ